MVVDVDVDVSVAVSVPLLVVDVLAVAVFIFLEDKFLLKELVERCNNFDFVSFFSWLV